MIRRIAADGTTIVIIEHTMHAMVRLADRFVVLDHGTVAHQASASDLRNDPAQRARLLGA